MTEEQKQENKEKGDKAEVLFSNYLNNKEIPFCHLDQKEEMKSIVFSDNDIQRPDFILFTKNGIVYADVKYRTKVPSCNSDEKRFYLNDHSTDRLSKFQTEFSADVWLAFTDNLVTPEFKFVHLSLINDFFRELCGYIYKNYSECIYFAFLRKCKQIPERLLLDKLDFDKSFNKNLEPEFIKAEAEYHIRQCVSYKKNAEVTDTTSST